MRTTLEIDENLLKTVVYMTGEKIKGRAVNKALGEYIQWKAIEGLRAMAGKIDLVDSWHELRHMEPR